MMGGNEGINSSGMDRLIQQTTATRRTIAIPGHICGQRWVHRKGIRRIKGICALRERKVIIADMLERAGIRLKRHAWSMVERPKRGTIEYPSPPPHPSLGKRTRDTILFIVFLCLKNLQRNPASPPMCLFHLQTQLIALCTALTATTMQRTETHIRHPLYCVMMSIRVWVLLAFTGAHERNNHILQYPRPTSRILSNA